MDLDVIECDTHRYHKSITILDQCLAPSFVFRIQCTENVFLNVDKKNTAVPLFIDLRIVPTYYCEETYTTTPLNYHPTYLFC